MDDALMRKNAVQNNAEVDRILTSIRDTLAPLKDDKWGARARIAERAGLSEKNVADFANKYGPGRNPQFRTTYKILRGILGRCPVDLEGTLPVITEETPMKILVAVDKSEESQQALRYTCHLLEHFEADVDALYVKPNLVSSVAESSYAPFTTREDVEKDIETEAEKTVEEIFEACELCLGGKVPCEPLVAVGDPADEILNLAHEGAYDLIVLGSQGRSTIRGFLLGSVHAKILHHALQPVLLMRNFRPIQKILVAYRGSQCDQGALEFIAPLFARQKPEITILHVQETALGETPEFAEACLLTGEDTLKQHGYSPTKKLAQGDFVDEILKAVAVERYDLLVLGAYGHKRPKYLKMISDEALNLVRLSTRPVLVFRDKTET